MKLNNKSGFTLLEIIIVIIIVGILVSLALPRFFETIEYSRSTEALNAMGLIKRQADRCSLWGANAGTGGPDFNNCQTFTAINLQDPGTRPDAHFTYSLSWNVGTNTYTITAYRRTINGGDGSSTITVNYDTANGTLGRVGTGAYGAIQ